MIHVSTFVRWVSCTLLVCSRTVNKKPKLSKLYWTLIFGVKGLSLPPEAHVWANTEMSYSLGPVISALHVTAHDLDFYLLIFDDCISERKRRSVLKPMHILNRFSCYPLLHECVCCFVGSRGKFTDKLLFRSHIDCLERCGAQATAPVQNPIWPHSCVWSLWCWNCGRHCRQQDRCILRSGQHSQPGRINQAQHRELSWYTHKSFCTAHQEAFAARLG